MRCQVSELLKKEEVRCGQQTLPTRLSECKNVSYKRNIIVLFFVPVYFIRCPIETISKV